MPFPLIIRFLLWLLALSIGGVQTIVAQQTAPAEMPASKQTAKPAAKKDPALFEGTIEYSLKLTGAVGDQIKSAMNNKITVKIKGSKILVKYAGAAQQYEPLGDLLIDGNANTVYRILHDKKMVQKKEIPMFKVPDSLKTQSRYKIDKRGTPQTVSGYACKVYFDSLDLPMAGGKISHWIWATSSIKIDVDTAVLRQTGSALLGDGLPGFPLKKVYTFHYMDMQFILEAVKIKKEALKDEDLALPTDYEVVEFNPAQMFEEKKP